MKKEDKAKKKTEEDKKKKKRDEELDRIAAAYEGYGKPYIDSLGQTHFSGHSHYGDDK